MSKWCLEVWGDYACFSRPEMKVERVSYDVITPSAARGIFEAILWKPAIRWNVTRIDVLKPIQWVSFRRNEVGKTIPNPTARQMAGLEGPSMGLFADENRQQRAGLFLKDVSYRLYGYFDFLKPEQRDSQGNAGSDETEAKYASMFERRATNGQCYHRPYLGCREFSCHYRLVDQEQDVAQPIPEIRDLGFMLYDMNFDENPEKPSPMIFRAHMNMGTINTDRRTVEVRG